MTYNPADYNAVMTEAKSKSKEDLEKYYTDNKSKNYTSTCQQIFTGIMIILLLSFIGYGVYIMGADSAEFDFSKKIIKVEDEICPLINDTYKSLEFFETVNRKNRIVCG